MNKNENLALVVATLCGFVTYFVMHNLFGIDFSIALFVGFVGAHAGLILGRRYLP